MEEFECIRVLRNGSNNYFSPIRGSH